MAQKSSVLKPSAEVLAVATATLMAKMDAECVAPCLSAPGSPMTCVLTPHFCKISHCRAKLFKQSVQSTAIITGSGVKIHPVKPRRDSQLPSVLWQSPKSRPEHRVFSWGLPQHLGILAKALWGVQRGQAVVHPSVGWGLQCTLHKIACSV